jgi:hypothetical protein
MSCTAKVILVLLWKSGFVSGLVRWPCRWVSGKTFISSQAELFVCLGPQGVKLAKAFISGLLVKHGISLRLDVVLLLLLLQASPVL